MPDTTRDAALLVARILLCALFVNSGWEKLLDPAGVAGAIAAKGWPLSDLLAPVVGGFELLAGLALAFGAVTRLSAVALALFTIAAGLLFHDFWFYAGEARAAQTTQLLKNCGIAGGLILVAALGGRRFSIDSLIARRFAAS